MSKKRERILLPNQPFTNPLQDSSPTSSNYAFLSTTPISTSPPSLSGFLSKPSKWFSRPSITSKNSAPETHRVRTISTARRAAISGPTDPRPIIPSTSSSKDVESNSFSSQSVLDLTLVPTSKFASKNDKPQQHVSAEPNVMGRKTWSRSVDDLRHIPDQSSVLINPPLRDESLAIQTRAKIEAYRTNSANPSFAFPSSRTAPTPPVALPDETTMENKNNTVAFPQIQHSGSKSLPGFSETSQPSPARNGSMSTFGREYDREHQTDRNGPFPSLATMPRAHGIPPNDPPTKHNPSSAPTSFSDDASKRSSQAIQFSGFLNRHTGSNAYLTFRSTHALSNVLAKGWKPYKAVLKGSKLYFYKPPSDRSVEIKELFPQGVNPILSELSQPIATVEKDPAEESAQLPGKDKDDIRKKTRLYRGRTTHPELAFTVGGFPATGTLDALLHETVFGNSFRVDDDLSTTRKRFSLCMMVCLPRIMGREKFEKEFIRYAVSFVNEAETHEQDRARAFASWISSLYISLHNRPYNERRWESYKSCIMMLESSTESSDSDPPIPSQQGVDIPSIGPQNDAGPVIGDLTDDLFLGLDPAKLAQSLFILHVRSLPGTYNTSLPVDLLDYALERSKGSQPPPFSCFFGSDEAPHWLSRLIVHQVLNPNSGSPKMSPDTQVSKTQLRSDIITHWIKVAEHCRGSGDRCTWKAIESALCSRPVARLEKVWRRTDLPTLRLFHSWTKDTEAPDIPIMTPWGGDILNKINSLWPKAKVELGGRDNTWDVEVLLKIYDCINSVQDQFTRSTLKPASGDENQMVTRLVKLWQNIQTQAPSRFRSIEDFMSLSLAAEPRLKGRFEAYHWHRTSNVAAVQSLIPLGFVEPSYTLSLVDRDVQRGKRDGSDVSSTQVHQIRMLQLFCMMSMPGDQGLDGILRNNSDGSGLVISLYDGDLLIEVPERSMEIPSRPSSILEPNLQRRTSQVRVTNGSSERKISVARRGSLPVLPQADTPDPSGQSSESPLRAIVKAGALDRLVDVLLFGLEGISVSVADDNGQAPLHGGITRTLKLDHEAFRMSWWSVFRSFVTPYVLFELFRKRFILAMTSAKIQRAIYLVVSHWIEKGGGINDALDDSELFRSMSTFLNTPLAESDNRDSLEWTSLEVLREQVAGLFLKRSRRPQLYAAPLSQSVIDSHPVNHGSQPPSLDELDPEILVDNLDALAANSVRSVTLDDLIVTSEILETQSADRLGWFLNYEPIINSDEIEIQTIYSHLQQVEPSILFSDNQESVYSLLPASIRGLIRTHAVIRKYLLSKIVTPRLGFRIRQTRMEMLLRTIEVCRLRTADPSSEERFANQGTARSFVETAIISAIVAPESRFFSAAWNSVAVARGATAESLDSLLANPVIQSVTNKNRLTVDIGWLLERFLEVISIPNLVEPHVEASTLINVEKRRYIHDLAILFLSLSPRSSRPRKLQNVLERSDTERLNNMHRQVTGPAFDIRYLRDEAYHESLNGATTHHKRNQRPFTKIVQLQQEKCKRDKATRERLIREKKAEQIKNDKREEDLNRAMHPGRPNAHTLKNQRSRRTMSSAFLQLMRPISSAFISGDQTDNGAAPVQRRGAQELDFPPTGKPSLVISLAGATVKNFVNNVRLYLFHVVTEDGGRYLLQASTRLELESWKSHIIQTAKLTSAKRLTYIGNSTRPTISQDQIEMFSQMGSRHPQAVFNVDLDVLLQREAGNSPVATGAVPHILDRCLAEIEARGLQEPGLYRVPGASSAINNLRTQFDTGQDITFFDRDYVDIFAICDVVKTWLRALPQSIFPEKSYQEAIKAIQMEDFEERLKAVRKTIHELPVNSMHLLRRVCEHLDRVTDYEEQNQMTAEALAVIFNPSLLRSPTNNFGLLMQNMKYTSQLLQMLITHFHRVFDEADVEQDDEADGDMAERIEDVTLHNTSESGRLLPIPTDILHNHDPDPEALPISRAGDGETRVF